MGIVTDNLPKVLDPVPGGKQLINAVDFIVNWARANSLWPLVFGTSCCAIEMMATGSSKWDWARFGTEVARATPRQADLIIMAGTIVEKMAPRLVTLYEQMPSSKYVIAMGACTVTGGPFYYDSYSIVRGGDRVIPVDVYIPGCPPRPEALLYGIMQLQALIKKDSIRNPWNPRPLVTGRSVDTFSQTAQEWEEKEKVKLEETSEARERFKKEHPDYKSYKHKRIPREDLPQVERIPPRQVGLSKTEIFNIIVKSFPDIKLYSREENTSEKVKQTSPETTLDFVIPVEQYMAFINFLKNHGDLKMEFLIELTAVDWQDHFDIIVHLLSIEYGHKIFLRCSLPHEDHPVIDTISHIYRSADWHEREVYDLFGIKFIGHPDLRRIFLEDHFVGHPLRKDFEDDVRIVKRPY